MNGRRDVLAWALALIIVAVLALAAVAVATNGVIQLPAVLSGIDPTEMWLTDFAPTQQAFRDELSGSLTALAPTPSP